MKTLNISRAEFSSFFGSTRKWGSARDLADYSAELEVSPNARTLAICWPDDKVRVDDFPGLIVVSDDELDDFFAWAATFLPPIRPITAFIRVLPWSVYQAANRRRGTPQSDVSTLLAGASLGEAMTYAVGRGFFQNLTMTAFEATYFIALGRAVMRGYDSVLLDYTSRNWHSVRQMSDLPSRRMLPEDLENLSSIILNLSGNSVFRGNLPASAIGIFEACDEIRKTGRMSDLSWRRIGKGAIPGMTFAAEMASSKERRVEVFEEAVRLISVVPLGQFDASFLIAYLASLVSGGSLEHAHLVFPLQEKLPMVMPLYGMCSALLPESRVLTDYSYLGLRLIRAMGTKEDLLSTPNCDIDVNELRVLMRGEVRSRNFRQFSSSSLRVEIAPTVSAVLRWGPKGEVEIQQTLFASPATNPVTESNQLLDLVDSLRDSLSLAEDMLSGRQSIVRSKNSNRGKNKR